MESFGIVRGLGKEMKNGSAVFVPGDEVEARLISPVYPRSLTWWVEFEGDVDEQGNQIRRCRELVKILTPTENP